MYNALSPSELAQLDAYWRASNYLSVGQIYLLDNPLLRKPLKREHVKPRLVGHWGTTPGLNLLYVHLNRVIAAHDLNVLFITGPYKPGRSLAVVGVVAAVIAVLGYGVFDRLRDTFAEEV